MDVNAEREEADHERRHTRFLACLSGIATGLLVGTVVFFAVYERAELQFLFSKPTAPAANPAAVVAIATPADTVAANK